MIKNEEGKAGVGFRLRWFCATLVDVGYYTRRLWEDDGQDDARNTKREMTEFSEKKVESKVRISWSWSSGGENVSQNIYTYYMLICRRARRRDFLLLT